MPVIDTLSKRSQKILWKRIALLFNQTGGICISLVSIGLRHYAPSSKKGRLSVVLTLAQRVIPDSCHYESVGQLLRVRMEMLGPTFIKLGQTLASREDLFSPDFINEMKLLFNQLPPVPFSEIENSLKESIAVPLSDAFRSIEQKPLGSASIGQAHRAITNDGEEVVLKVIKPGVRDIVLADIIIFRLLSKMLQLVIPHLSPKRLIEEFCAMSEREVDLSHEADHLELFRRNFAGMPSVKFPRVYHALSSSDVLCMEFFSGHQPDEKVKDHLSMEQREQIVSRGTEALMQMFFVDGCFHADLHTGNLIILTDGTIGLIDLGMIGYIDGAMKRDLLQLMVVFSQNDADGTVKMLAKLASTNKRSDISGFKRRVHHLLQIWSLRSGEEQNLTFQLCCIINEAYKHSVFLPPELTPMLKAMLTFEMVGKAVCPTVDIKKVARDKVKRIYLQQCNPLIIGRALVQSIPLLLPLCEQLPQMIEDAAIEKKGAPGVSFLGLQRTIVFSACLLSSALLYSCGTHPMLCMGLAFFGIIACRIKTRLT